MASVHHDGRRTAYRRTDRGGDGAPLLLVHGSGGTGAVWRAQSRLADRGPVVAVDLSGHGDSENVETPAGPETLAAYADDVAAVAEATGARVLGGNSLGGAVALHLAIEDRLPLDALVLVGTGAKLAVREDLRRWLADDFDRAVEFLHAPGRLLAGDDPRLREASLEAMRAVGRRVTERDFLTAHDFDVRDRLGGVAVPALALTGEADALTPPRYHAYLADHLPAGRWRTVEGAAHLSMLERPAAFNDAVASFLDDADG